MADLTSTLAATIASLVGASSPGTTTQGLYSAIDTNTITRRATNIFLPSLSNYTCIAWKQNPANTFAAHATAIGTKSLLCAAHVAPAVGATGYCYNAAGTAVPYTVASVYQIPGTDTCLITTSATLTGIVLAKLLPATWRNYIHKTDDKVYVAYLTQDEKVFVAYTTGNLLSSYSTSVLITSDTADTYYSWYQLVRGGDSSSPCFAIFNGDLVLITSWQGVNLGPTYSDMLSSLQSAMTTRSGDVITYADMSSFSTVSDPATASTPPTHDPVPQPPLPGLPVVTYRVGISGDISYASAVTSLKTNFSTSANYVFSMLGDLNLTGNTISVGQITGGAAGSSLSLVPDTTNTASTTALLQADNAGQPLIRTSTDTIRVSNSANNLQALSISGMQYGSSTSGGFLSSSCLGSPCSVSVSNCVFRAVNTATLFAINVSDGGAFNLSDTVFIANNSVSATQVMFALSGTGASNAVLSHVSCHVSGAPLGFMSVAMNANQIRTLTLSDMPVNSTNSSFGFFGTITLASGASTLVLNGSGIRCGVWNATAVAATGVTIIDNTTDVLQGVVSASVYANTALGLRILANSTTLATATTTPVATDIDGNNRPTTNGTQSGLVWVGCENFVIGAATSSVVRVGADATLTFSFSGADHFAVSVDGGAYTTQTSPYTATGKGIGAHSFAVQAINAANFVIGQGAASLPGNGSNLAMNLLLGII